MSSPGESDRVTGRSPFDDFAFRDPFANVGEHERLDLALSAHGRAAQATLRLRGVDSCGREGDRRRERAPCERGRVPPDRRRASDG